MLVTSTSTDWEAGRKPTNSSERMTRQERTSVEGWTLEADRVETSTLPLCLGTKVRWCCYCWCCWCCCRVCCAASTECVWMWMFESKDWQTSTQSQSTVQRGAWAWACGLGARGQKGLGLGWGHVRCSGCRNRSQAVWKCGCRIQDAAIVGWVAAGVDCNFPDFLFSR